MKSAAYKKEVKGLIKKIETLDENCKALILNNNDYKETINAIGRLSSTLYRNTKEYNVSGSIPPVKVKLHNSNKDTQIIAKLASPGVINITDVDENTTFFIANDETCTFLIDTFEYDDVISMYHEVFSSKEYKNMILTEFDNCNYPGLIKVRFKYLV